MAPALWTDFINDKFAKKKVMLQKGHWLTSSCPETAKNRNKRANVDIFRLVNTWHSTSRWHTSPASTTVRLKGFADELQKSQVAIKSILPLFTIQVSGHPPAPWSKWSCTCDKCWCNMSTPIWVKPLYWLWSLTSRTALAHELISQPPQPEDLRLWVWTGFWRSSLSNLILSLKKFWTQPQNFGRIFYLPN